MKEPRRVDIDQGELKQIMARAKEALGEDDYRKIEWLVESFTYITQVLENKRTTIKRLRKLIFGSGSEKTSKVTGEGKGGGGGKSAGGDAGTDSGSGGDASGKETSDGDKDGEKKKKKRPGHGRNGADSYTGAERVCILLEGLKSGDRCPDCSRGNVNEEKKPGVIVRVTGQAPLQATVYELQRLRCNTCGKVFTAVGPPGVGNDKYDESATAMIGLLKYGSGMPFNRLEGLQANLRIPLPAATQWEKVAKGAAALAPVCDELTRQAAQGKLLHNDDTGCKVLALMKENKSIVESGDKEARTGMFTTGIVSVNEGRSISLFFSGREHAGENIDKVLKRRDDKLGPPIQMCDALSRNTSGESKTIEANCNAHGRRRYVDVVDNFPDECSYVLKMLREIYKNDDIARKQGMSPEKRLFFHQTESGPLMEELKEWMTDQIEERKVEPNSGLGEAITYMLEHWEKLTLFLKVAGVPLDNNICERALKKAILHRKNSLFYKTMNGARVGDAFMSLIHTAELNGANAFDYLTELLRHRDLLADNPSAWMPWNYKETLTELPST